MDSPTPGPGWRAQLADLAARSGEHRRTLAALVGAMAVIAIALAWWRSGPAAPALPPLPAAPTAAPTTTTTVAPDLVVHVVGAVRRPGVVRVPGGARVVDAVAAAGGATPRADLARLNLAAPLPDGARVAVPVAGESSPMPVPGDVGLPTASGGGGAPDAPVDVNRATAAELEELPGVGPATAAAIVREREENGPFRSPDDLERVRGIGPAKVAALRDRIRV